MPRSSVGLYGDLSGCQRKSYSGNLNLSLSYNEDFSISRIELCMMIKVTLTTKISDYPRYKIF
jgi:hypothetical protein